MGLQNPDSPVRIWVSPPKLRPAIRNELPAVFYCAARLEEEPRNGALSPVEAGLRVYEDR